MWMMPCDGLQDGAMCDAARKVAALRGVRHDDMGMCLRIELSAQVMVKDRVHQATGLDHRAGLA